MHATQLNRSERVEKMFDFNDSQCSEVFQTERRESFDFQFPRVDGKHFISPEGKGLGNQKPTTEKHPLTISGEKIVNDAYCKKQTTNEQKHNTRYVTLGHGSLYPLLLCFLEFLWCLT